MKDELFENQSTHVNGAPVVRLAIPVSASDSGAMSTKNLSRAVNVNYESGREAPALLVSYYYLEPFVKNRAAYRYQDWVMDSGAFSAHNSGVTISLSAYVDKCLELLASDPTLTEVFALDEIPKSPSEADVGRAMERSLRNTEEMWRQGVHAIPCFHCGEPEEALLHVAREYPKVALGGMVRKGGGIMSQDEKFGWLEQCFARIWPKKVHGFGVSAERMVWGLPFHSVDATNWEIGPCAFGNWQRYGTMSVRGSNQDLRSQVRHYLDMEAKARVRWARQMAELEALAQSPVKLGARPASSARRTDGAGALDAGSADGQRAAAALSARSGPDGRLALNGPRVDAGTTGIAIGGGEPEPPKRAAEPAPEPAKGELDERWRKPWWM